MQKRWVAAVAFSLAFFAAFSFSSYQWFCAIFGFYSLAFDFNHARLPSCLPWHAALLSTLAALGVYVLSLLDTWCAYRRAWRRHSDRREQQILLGAANEEQHLDQR